MDKYLIQQGFQRSNTNINLYLKFKEGKLLVTVVYVDDLIFGRNEEGFTQTFSKEMEKEYEMSMIGKLTYFLGLHISQDPTGIFASQSKYLKEMLKTLA